MDTQPLERDPYRLRVRVCHLDDNLLRPFGWELYDDATGALGGRSEVSYRTSREAFAAGTATLDAKMATQKRPTQPPVQQRLLGGRKEAYRSLRWGRVVSR